MQIAARLCIDTTAGLHSSRYCVIEPPNCGHPSEFINGSQGELSSGWHQSSSGAQRDGQKALPGFCTGNYTLSHALPVGLPQVRCS
jgi:hypothetical protein